MNPTIKTEQPQDKGFMHIQVICDVCGESRRTHHHPRCSKIRQQRYRREATHSNQAAGFESKSALPKPAKGGSSK